MQTLFFLITMHFFLQRGRQALNHCTFVKEFFLGQFMFSFFFEQKGTTTYALYICGTQKINTKTNIT
jgi:hypothetical protein